MRASDEPFLAATTTDAPSEATDEITAHAGTSNVAVSISTTLGRLAERRLVIGRVGAPVAGRAGRPRKYYALTPAGARDLQESYTTIRALAGGVLQRLNRLAEQESSRRAGVSA